MPINQSPDQQATASNGFIARNDPRLILVPAWPDFVSWAKDSGYDESYLDINDSKCQHIQELYLAELAADEGSRMAGE